MSGLSAAIKQLLDSPEPLKHSDFSVNQRKSLDEFAQRTRQIEIVKQGRSTLYRVLNRQGLLRYFQQLHPLEEDALPADFPVRGRNVGVNRNSKKGKSSHESCYLLMKAWTDGVAWRDEQNTLPVSTVTQQFGVAALQIHADQTWHCNRTLLLVENQALFDRCDWLNADFDGCLIYYAGQIAEVLLQWFAEYRRCEQVILFPDYDGIGLNNYARLAESIHPQTRLNFYWLPNWQNKLIKFGDAELWAKTRTQFENAYERLKNLGVLDNDLMELARLSQHHGKALEQEVVWL